jgi:hypothetical protein
MQNEPRRGFEGPGGHREEPHRRGPEEPYRRDFEEPHRRDFEDVNRRDLEDTSRTRSEDTSFKSSEDIRARDVDETSRRGSETRRFGSAGAERDRRGFEVHEHDRRGMGPYERGRRLGRLDLGSRLSWSGLIAGLFVALAVQLSLSALGVWAGFGLADIGNLDALVDVSATVGIWIAVSALVSVFLAAMVAAWVGGSATATNGLWHGVVVWALVITVAVMMSVFGLTGVLGFAATPGQLTDALPIETAETDIPQAVTTSAEFAGWFLLGTALSLGAALLGGWVGTLNAGRRALMREDTREEEFEQRRAA